MKHLTFVFPSLVYDYESGVDAAFGDRHERAVSAGYPVAIRFKRHVSAHLAVLCRQKQRRLMADVEPSLLPGCHMAVIDCTCDHAHRHAQIDFDSRIDKQFPAVSVDHHVHTHIA